MVTKAATAVWERAWQEGREGTARLHDRVARPLARSFVHLRGKWCSVFNLMHFILVLFVSVHCVAMFAGTNGRNRKERSAVRLHFDGSCSQRRVPSLGQTHGLEQPVPKLLLSLHS